MFPAGTSIAAGPDAARRSSEGVTHEMDSVIDADTVQHATATGSSDARLTIVEFSDYQCPFCAEFHKSSFPAIQRELVETGKVKYIVLNLPLDRIHPHATKAAEVAECLHLQGKYWSFRETLFRNQSAMELTDLKRHARQTGADEHALDDCLKAGRMVAKVRDQQAVADRLGVGGTPTFLLGEIQPDGAVRVKRRLDGGQDVAHIRAALDEIGSPSSLRRDVH